MKRGNNFGYNQFLKLSYVYAKVCPQAPSAAAPICLNFLTVADLLLFCRVTATRFDLSLQALSCLFSGNLK